MKEYFIHAHSFAAPFFSDASTAFVKADSPQAALEKFAASYDHPCGLYSAIVYADANAYHKNTEPLARWLCNQEIEKQRLTADLGSYSYRGDGPGKFQVDGEWHNVKNPKGGRIIP